ncbi:hypothetical protein [Aureimonas sp. AU40]|uniref:hypothetical protein n=1 Tax=Aureimonas sp. AU40 TaxID=1637747 RepID=UPI000782FECE|nr:hypothetical protein [Aureimonas sp. AU40]
MPFAARKHDDGTWRLCKRMGDTLLTATFDDGTVLAIGPFPSQAKTKACADVLNERWKDYERAVKKGEFSDELATWLIQTVRDHDGLESAKSRNPESEKSGK